MWYKFFTTFDDVNQAFYDGCVTSGHIDRTDPGVVLDAAPFFKSIL